MIGDTRQDVGEPGPWVDIVESCRGDERIHCCGPFTTAIAARKQPALPANSSRAFILRISAGTWRIHYRWHALYGCRVRQLYAERRSGTEVVIVEAELGIAIVLAAWMLDPAVCAPMSLRPPIVDVAGLADLYRLLKALGLWRTCSDEPPCAREVHHAIAIASDWSARHAVLRRLAHILVQAADADPEELGDDER
jgi:hypothetical protein